MYHGAVLTNAEAEGQLSPGSARKRLFPSDEYSLVVTKLSEQLFPFGVVGAGRVLHGNARSHRRRLNFVRSGCVNRLLEPITKRPA